MVLQSKSPNTHRECRALPKKSPNTKKKCRGSALDFPYIAQGRCRTAADSSFCWPLFVVKYRRSFCHRHLSAAAAGALLLLLAAGTVVTLDVCVKFIDGQRMFRISGVLNCNCCQVKQLPLSFPVFIAIYLYFTLSKTNTW